jgi:hypothetical protein
MCDEIMRSDMASGITTVIHPGQGVGIVTSTVVESA